MARTRKAETKAALKALLDPKLHSEITTGIGEIFRARLEAMVNAPGPFTPFYAPGQSPMQPPTDSTKCPLPGYKAAPIEPDLSELRQFIAESVEELKKVETAWRKCRKSQNRPGC